LGHETLYAEQSAKLLKQNSMKYLLKSLTSEFFFQTYKTYAAVARKWAEMREDFRTRCNSCLHIVCSNKKSFTVRTQCLHSLCRIDVGDVASSETAEAIIRVFQLTRNRVTRFLGSSNVNAIDRAKWIASFSKGVSNYSSSTSKVGRGQSLESLGEMKINCMAGWVLSRPLAIWVRSEKWCTIKMHGVCYVVRRNRLYFLIRLIYVNSSICLFPFLNNKKKEEVSCQNN